MMLNLLIKTRSANIVRDDNKQNLFRLLDAHGDNKLQIWTLSLISCACRNYQPHSPQLPLWTSALIFDYDELK